MEGELEAAMQTCDDIFKPCLECENAERSHLRWVRRESTEPPAGSYVDVILCSWCDLETWYLHFPGEAGCRIVGIPAAG